MIVGLVLGVPVSALLLWLAIRGSDAGKVKRALGDAKLGPLALAASAFIVVYAAQAERWRRIAAVGTTGWRTFAELVVSSVACNNVLPARIGDLLRARWLGRSAGLPAGRALATVVLDRACDLLVLFAYLLVTLPEVAGSGWSYRIAIATLAILVGIAILLVFARAYTRRRARARIESRNLVRRVLRDVVEGLAEPMGRRRLGAAIALSAVAWLAFGGAAVGVGRSVGIHLGVLDALFVTAVINLGVAIPSSPGFVGTYQWLGVASLGLLDVDRSRALAFAILLQAVWFVPTTLLGGGLLARRGLRRVTAADAVRKPGSESAS